MSERAILFDLDGTLVDTVPDLARALNLVRREHNLPELPEKDIRPHISKGARGLIAFGLPTVRHDEIEQLANQLVEHYRQLDHQHSRLFAPWSTLLKIISPNRLGIVTNKPRALTERLLEILKIKQHFSTVVCGDDCPVQKPDPLPLLRASQQLGVSPEHCLYLGDAKRDMEAAVNANMQPVLVQWGYFASGQPQNENWPYVAFLQQNNAYNYCVRWLNALD